MTNEATALQAEVTRLREHKTMDSKIIVGLLTKVANTRAAVRALLKTGIDTADGAVVPIPPFVVKPYLKDGHNGIYDDNYRDVLGTSPDGSGHQYVWWTYLAPADAVAIVASLNALPPDFWKDEIVEEK